MNRTLTFVLTCISLPAWSASPITSVSTSKPSAMHSPVKLLPECLAQESHLSAAT